MKKYPANNYVREQIYSFQHTQGFDKLNSKKTTLKIFPF